LSPVVKNVSKLSFAIDAPHVRGFLPTTAQQLHLIGVKLFIGGGGARRSRQLPVKL
jgi:hypothetical protein